MSGEGPDSVPTSADPRSKRPTKRRALTPSTAQASSLDALFAKPDQDIRLPADALLRRSSAGAGAPEIVTNVQGSSAGAGSGEFHVYKAARRREYERLRAMDEEVKGEKEAEDFDRVKRERAARDEERTRKNREKRDKKRKKGNGGQPAGGGGGGGGGVARRDVKAGADADTETKDGAEAAPSSAAQPAGLVIHDDD